MLKPSSLCPPSSWAPCQPGEGFGNVSGDFWHSVTLWCHQITAKLHPLPAEGSPGSAGLEPLEKGDLRKKSGLFCTQTKLLEAPRAGGVTLWDCWESSLSSPHIHRVSNPPGMGTAPPGVNHPFHEGIFPKSSLSLPGCSWRPFLPSLGLFS